MAIGKYPTEKKVNSVVSHLPVQFYFFAGGRKEGRRGRKNIIEYFSKSLTLFYCHIELYLNAADLKSMESTM